MNRIYQGRVSRAKIIDQKGNVISESDWNGESALWEHHALFQDAVNYYVVCLLALAGPGNALWPIREKLDAKNEAGDDELMVWRPFRRRGALRRGLRDSIAKYLTPGNDTPTPNECFAAALAGNECSLSEEGMRRLDTGLAQLLDKCTGPAGCKQAAPVFLPRFAKPAYNGNYGADTSTLAREDEGARFPFVLHDPGTTAASSSLDEFSAHSIALPNEKKPKFSGKEAVAKLFGMVADWRERQPASEDDWQRLEAVIGKLPDDFTMSGYAATSAKSAVKFRLFAMFFFRYVERSEFTLGLLRATTKMPEVNEVPPVRIAPSRAGDPIRTGRGSRGYVFRAFTSLPCWGGDDEGSPTWINFDFAAFEEALKALHQVDAKAEEREKARELKQGQHDYQRGKTKKWKGGGEGEESIRPPVLAGDPRIARLAQLVDEELREEYEMSEGVSVKYGLHQRTIRGFRDVRKQWNDLLAEGEGFSEAAKQKIRDALTAYKIENAQTMGSPTVFDAMLERRNWIIWREPTVELLGEWRNVAKLADDAEFAKDPLQALTDERELLEEIDRLRGPIRFTPADPEHSRRQFYFSDASPLDKKRRLRHDRQALETEIALRTGNKWACQWVRITFTAPRLLRDQLNNASGVEAAWQQAMMVALGLKTGLAKNGKPARFEDCAAVALMPEVGEHGEKRILLNFPLTLDGEAIANQLGKAVRWDALQFGGADRDSFWLRWPKTWIDEKKERKKTPPTPWWRGSATFRVLSVDLGQRDAGAFALLEASAGIAPKPQSRKLGEGDDGKIWWATVRATGMLRLPGENAHVMRDGQRQEEFSGARGRNPIAGEWAEGQDICAKLGFIPDKMLGTDESRRSVPELNDDLLYALRRAQSRLARLQSWSCLAYEEADEKNRASFDKRRARIQEQMVEALSARAVEEKKPAEERGQELPERGGWLDEVRPLIEKQAWAAVAERIKREIGHERASIQRELLRIADRVQPLRGRRWEWVPRPNDSANHILRQTERGTDDRLKLLAGQRGLSLKRVEQLESLRQRCQSLNRALMQEPGVPAKLGRSKRGIELPDPCPELLDRLEALKEQRVNQTAHLILAQALGVRLRVHTQDATTRATQDIHGEYERIPGREPVDFLVLENLDRYLASQGRSRGENSKLMKWCHRAILGKLKQLCEPYGLRVLETPAAYSSKFCSLTGVAGFRAVELSPEDAKEFRWKKHLDRLNAEERGERKLLDEEREESQRVKAIFDALGRINAGIRQANPSRPKWRTLLAPVAGGPIFVPASGMEHYERRNPKTGKIETAIRFAEVAGRHPAVVQADINAAINLGLRAIASPEADDIHLRIRAKRDGDTFVVRAENKREIKRWGVKPPVPITVPDEANRKKLLTEAHLNFFADLGRVAGYDRAEIAGNKTYASGRGIWGTLKGNKRNPGKDWLCVAKINEARIRNALPPDEDVRY